ncbi:hypothetical protein GCM10009785_13890 [Brooklawnia cerclae]|uniref:Uncharacterized protein n=1 Tax=Brooklawnia cerclae TaxID=349934 RepID=A0ABX0SMT1_9ACTN|nr:hypothetical protein [Brooklawnia cerclae]NIH58042.1 hypothetical protein [Brooklawnia cerclae]
MSTETLPGMLTAQISFRLHGGECDGSILFVEADSGEIGWWVSPPPGLPKDEHGEWYDRWQGTLDDLPDDWPRPAEAQLSWLRAALLLQAGEDHHLIPTHGGA